MSALTGVDAAVAMAALGYHVHPCRLVLNERGVKVPSGLPDGWQSAGLTDAAAITMRWQAVHANAYMIACGPSGITAIDLDVKDGVDGRASWSGRPGFDHRIDEGRFMVFTPGGGQHHYFASAGAGNRTALMPGVDVRGVGGGLFGPGSAVLDQLGNVVGEYRVTQGRNPAREQLTAEPPIVASLPRSSTGAKIDPTSFFAPSMSAATAQARARQIVADLRAMPNIPGSGMRQRINDAALFLGGVLHCGWFDLAGARAALMDACTAVYGAVDGEDVRWIDTALADGANKPVTVIADAPQTRDFLSNANDDSSLSAPRRLPMIGDKVWSAYRWSQAIRSRARAVDVCPDAVLGAMLATYAARLPPSLRIDTGTKMPIGGNLVVSLVGPSGSDKSTAFRLAQTISSGSAVPVVNNPNSGEAFAASYVMPDPDGDGAPSRRARVLKTDPRALFYVAEGGMLAGVASRLGSTWLPHLRALAMDEALSTTNATSEINRQVPANSYSAGVVVGFQVTTAMTVLVDTATGTSQRFLWFTSLSSEDEAAVASQDVPMAVPIVTRLAESVDEHNNPVHTLHVTRGITDRVKAEQRALRLTRDITATDDHDAHRHTLVAKLAAVAVLADDRVLIEEGDWAWAEELYAASAAVRAELLHLAEDRDTEVRTVTAVRHAETDHVRKSYATDVQRVAEVLLRRVEKVGPQTRGVLRAAVRSTDRAYFDRALALAESTGVVLVT